jgi:hypothetical protein
MYRSSDPSFVILRSSVLTEICEQPTPAHARAIRMTECTCFASALQVSDQLHRVEAALTSTSFDKVLGIARHASGVCCHYASCGSCPDPSYFTIYIIILRKVAACYSYFANSPSYNSSPGTSSTSSGASSQGGSSGGTSRLRIGTFEIEAPVDDHARTVILRTEVRRAADAATELDAVLGPGSIKAAVYRDEATLMYLRGLVTALREEIVGVERILYSM